MNKTNSFLKVLVAVTFLAMVIINVLSTRLPINGVTPDQVSDSFPNLFAPAGLTFAIWGLIYLLLACHTLYFLGLFHKNDRSFTAKLLNKTGVYFILSSLANGAWIFAWHYFMIPLSMILMIVILVCLGLINQEINKQELSLKERFFIRLPFSIYFGWITVATIANATTLLVSWGWNGFGISQPAWAVIIISVGMLIGIAVMLKNKDIAYGMVLIWAYTGILIKHLSASGFAGNYPAVIWTVIICLALLAAGVIYVFALRRKNLKFGM